MNKNRVQSIDIAKFKEQNIFSIEEYLELLSHHNPLVLDVRSRPEYCSGHLCGALNIQTPLPPIYPNDIIRLENTLDRICVEGPQTSIIVYCKLGKRAGLAKRILNDLGYTNVLSLGGTDTEPLKSLMEGKNPQIPICYCQGAV